MKALALQSDDQLPVVIPLVLYNGETPWTAKTDIYDLIAPAAPGMSDYLPRLRYKLIDIRRLPLAELAAMRNAVAGLFRVEASPSLAVSRAAIDDLIDLLDPREHAAIRHDVTRWVCEVVLPSRMEDVTVEGVRDLEEVSTMITENTLDWTAEWRMKGREEGLVEGRKEGRNEGRKEGRKEGREEGREEGRKEGEASLLRRQLKRRFADLPGWIDKRLEQASQQELESWTDRVLEAKRLEDVFSPA